MLSSPQSLTIDSVATDCHRINDEKSASIYASTDGTLTFKVSHQESKARVRRMARVDKTVIAADPLTAENAYQKAGVYVVIDEPNFGFDDDEIIDLVEGLKTWLSTANISAMLASRH
jgi:hypothetical protein